MCQIEDRNVKNNFSVTQFGRGTIPDIFTEKCNLNAYR